jgi:hypothetical protein
MEHGVTVRLALRGITAVVTLAATVLLVLAAIDVLGWRGQTQRASVALDRRSNDPDIWRPGTILPTGLSEWLVGAEDDVAFGRGLQEFRTLRRIPSNAGAASGGAYQANQVAIAETQLALERLAQRPLPRTLRSRAQELSAIAQFEHLITGTSSLSSQTAPLEQTQLALARAIRTDPGNDAAKADLEQLFRLYAQVLHVSPEELRLHPNKTGSKSGAGGSSGTLLGGGGY